MDEITLINLLNKICDKSGHLTWKLRCNYLDETSPVMQVWLYGTQDHRTVSTIVFRMETGMVISGQHRGVVAFRHSTNLIDALLEILFFENSRSAVSLN